MNASTEATSLVALPCKRKHSEVDEDYSSVDIKRFHGDINDDLTSSFSSSGYESDSEEETVIHTSKKRKRHITTNEERLSKRMRYEEKRLEQENFEKSNKSKISDNFDHYSAGDFSLPELNTSSSSASDSSSGSDVASSLSSASSDDDSCSNSSDESLVDTSSDSSSDSLGLSLSDTSTSSSSSSEDYDSLADDNYSLCNKRLMPKIIKCPKSCVCKIGCSSPPKAISRRGGVSIPLYRRLLTCRMLSDENVSKYDCCEDSCYVYWIHKIRKYSLQ